MSEAVRHVLETGADQRVDAENPWPGLSSFREQDEEFFRGRGAEAELLERLVQRERLTVMFGLSGLGKTSLLNAGLFPRLRPRRILPVYIRLDFSGQLDFRRQVLDAIARAAAESRVEAPQGDPGRSLWEYFHRQNADFWNARNRLTTPLLVFDQFEEIFTLGQSYATRERATRGLVTELAELIEGHPPAELRERLDADPGSAREFSFRRHGYKILLSLREDFLPHLEELRDRIPSIVYNRLRLQRMNGGAAMQVVHQEPALITEEVARRIIRFVAAAEDLDAESELADVEIEPAQLCVVCRELNNKRRQRGEPTITGDLLEGSRDEILVDLYDQSVADLAPEVRTLIEEQLLTVSGFRDSIAIENALGTPGVTAEQIDKLINRRLLRAEERGGVRRIELTHDLLTGVIGASRDVRRQREAEASERAARKAAEAREQEALRRLRRSRLLAAAFLVLMGVAAAGAVVGFNGWRRSLEAEEKAIGLQDKAEQAQAAAEKANREIERLLLLSNEQRGRIQSLNEMINAPLRKVATPRARAARLEQLRQSVTGRDGRQLFAITLWVDLPDLRRAEVERVIYYFDHEIFYPKEKIGDDAAAGFSITYTGWGCLDDVQLTLVQVDGGETKILFDSCAALEKERGISALVPKKGAPDPGSIPMKKG